MRISGTEPSSVILSQRKKFENSKVMSQKCRIKVKPKGEPVPFPSWVLTGKVLKYCTNRQ